MGISIETLALARKYTDRVMSINPGEGNDSSKEDIKNKVTAINDTSTDKQYPSAKAVYEFVMPFAATADNAFRQTDALVDKVTEAEKNIQTATKIAKGANKALTFDNYYDMMYYIAANDTNTTSNEIPAGIDMKNPNSEYYLPKGTNVYIKELNVPDLWVMDYLDSYKSFGDYIENNDYPLSDLKENGYFDAGYLRLAALETQKVDLSAYYDKTEIDSKVNIKADKITITTTTDTTASVTLNGNTETRYNEVTSLTISFPEALTDGYISSVVFTSGTTATTVSIPTNVYMQGTDCSDGVFTPTANKRYTVIFSYDGEILSGIVNGIPKAVSE